MPQTAKRGSVVEIKTLVQHAMEPGYRRDNEGRAIERNIVGTFVVSYDGVEIFKCDLQPGTAANPYIAFSTIATATGELVFTWTEEKGAVTTERRTLTVT
jgi:sulfur-oxidizing protein SoxZ